MNKTYLIIGGSRLSTEGTPLLTSRELEIIDELKRESPDLIILDTSTMSRDEVVAHIRNDRSPAKPTKYGKIGTTLELDSLALRKLQRATSDSDDPERGILVIDSVPQYQYLIRSMPYRHTFIPKYSPKDHIPFYNRKPGGKKNGRQY